MNNELKHYGVLGMKWGVRKDNKYINAASARAKRIVEDPFEYATGGIRNEASRYSNILKYGWKKGHGKNVYSRIKRIKNDDSRMSLMNQSQRQSLKNAEKYWKNRAEGMGYRKSGKRNIIKRAYDAHRSQSLGRRFVGTTMSVMGSRTVADAASAYGSMVTDELLNKLFGHF